jgi:arginyl-tRNA synthetase
MPANTLKEILTEKITAAAQKIYNQAPEGLEIGFPPSTDLGHFAVACFPLAKQFRKSPAEIARKIAENMVVDDVLRKAIATGPYLNLTVSPAVLFGDICSEIISTENSYGKSPAGLNKRVMVEYLSPNTNKPLHLGHLRNGLSKLT